MKFNRILSSLLVIVLLATGIIAAFPIAASAAEETPVINVATDAERSETEIKAIVAAYKGFKFNTAQEMLESDLANGYLDSLVYKGYALYVNRYTGVVYYVNNLTGQILTSNPFDTGKYPNSAYDVLSQIELTYTTHASPDDERSENSIECINNGTFITVSKTDNGIKVHYILGEAQSIYLVPGAMLMDDAEEYVIKPMFAELARIISSHGVEFPEGGFKSEGLTFTSFNGYESNKNDMFFKDDFYGSRIIKVVNAIRLYIKNTYSEYSAVYSEVSKFYNNVTIIFDQDQYQLKNPAFLSEKDYDTQIKLWYEKVPAMESTGLNAFMIDNTVDVSALETVYRLLGKAIKSCVPTMTSELARQIEERSGYTSALSTIPSFECDLIYSINDDGTLSVDFPANAIVYDEDVFILKSITPLRYFGVGDMVNDGYVFFPDGSGTVIEFEDFYSPKNPHKIRVSAGIYGKDYCYATLSGKHKEQVTMPVYGVVNEVKANATTNAITGTETITNGFFAILEEGSSLATLEVKTVDGTSYTAASASYTPYSYDRYSLSSTASANSGYLVVSDTPYTGSYKTRYTMLVDSVLSSAANLTGSYDSSYVGMANCYRDYLKASGILEKASTDATVLPLYIEVLGAMDVTKRIMTFPVSVSTPLTTFDDIQTMYAELSEKGITNINFRLTGFANGGMYYTYPAKVKWEKSLGGKRDFKNLVSAAGAYASDNNSNTNFGIYPDFDFQYISNTAMFDGVGNQRHAAKLVDNRYASKQIYNSISGRYESIFSILVSSDMIDGLYNKFQKRYNKFGLSSLSVSTLGSDLNSNFDDDNSLSREKSRENVVALLDRMANQNNYSLMTDIGNMYAVKYVDHILNATIDSSHFIFSSYAVPFYGMVLHSYVNYAGTPINYTGSVDYNILHSIENGASLYYILCMQNSNYLKEDDDLSKYFGVDYKNWFNKIVEQYTKLNNAIGAYQNYEIVYHSALIGERIMNSVDTAKNNHKILNEYVEKVDELIAKLADDTFDSLVGDPANIGKGIHISVDVDSIKANAADRFNLTAEELSALDFDTLLAGLVAKYNAEYPEKTGAYEVSFTGSDVVYDSAYDFVTDSLANSDEYDYTELTSDNGNIVMVTYKDTANTGKSVVFILNYNSYDVEVKIDNTIDTSLADGEVKTIVVEALDYKPIEIN